MGANDATQSMVMEAKGAGGPFFLIQVGGQYGQKTIMPTQAMMNQVAEAFNEFVRKGDGSGLVVPFWVNVKMVGGSAKADFIVLQSAMKMEAEVDSLLGLIRPLMMDYLGGVSSMTVKVRVEIDEAVEPVPPIDLAGVAVPEEATTGQQVPGVTVSEADVTNQRSDASVEEV